MKRNLFIAVPVIIIVIAAGILATMSRDDNGKQSTSTQTSQDQTKQPMTNNQAEANELTTSIGNLTKDGMARKCTYSTTTEKGSGNGTIYTDGKGKSRMTMVIASNQGNNGTTDTLIRDGKYYTWFTSQGQTFGFSGELGATTNSANTNTAPTSTNSAPDTAQDFAMKCEKWSVDDTKFTVPSGVNFNSLPISVPGQ